MYFYPMITKICIINKLFSLKVRLFFKFLPFVYFHYTQLRTTAIDKLENDNTTRQSYFGI